MMRHLPNVITLGRIMLTPVIGVTLARGDARGAFPLIFAAGVSDALDGWLARRFGWKSKLGSYLDPIADKALLATLFLGLGFSGAMPWWLVALVFGRDLLILAFAAYAMLFTSIRTFPPSMWGKISTFFQLLVAGGCVMRLVWPDFWLSAVVTPLMWVTAAATIWSGIDYARTGARMLSVPSD